jgi:hypothetical protein
VRVSVGYWIVAFVSLTVRLTMTLGPPRPRVRSGDLDTRRRRAGVCDRWFHGSEFCDMAAPGDQRL